MAATTEPLERAAPGLAESLQSAADVRDYDRLGADVGGGEPVGTGDPMRLLDGIADLMEPRALASESLAVVTEWTKIALGRSDVELPPRDKRFADPAWTDNPIYHRWAQGYLAWSEAVERLAGTPRLKAEWKREARARFTAALVTSMLAPTNLLAATRRRSSGRSTRPGSACCAARATPCATSRRTAACRRRSTRRLRGGREPRRHAGVRGLPRGDLRADRVRADDRSVGSIPLLMSRPRSTSTTSSTWRRGGASSSTLVGRGIHFFTIVWRNPREGHGHWGIENYVEAQLRAIDIVARHRRHPTI